ncbi:alkaline phosphatase [Parabacteroides sp. PFB2-10]|uniref:alkaline phosphatase n=1 Tax=Parabacteroides sp. PFB2-10 TaxID=1742405 RepID=UPI002472F9C3|nr:alkaline phosphatase [Parabacteroides sp. PFB2-10]MDH6312090.1 alkaline phosphatase [Parabacteroides sp. PFB2-10]
MKRTIIFSLLLTIILWPAQATQTEEVKPVKNLIVLIPDGCSLPVVSVSRWLQWYANPDQPDLHIDPYLCGTVSTFSSNAPIGDSAPTTSCYMTGYPSRTGYVSTYPVADGDNDIFPMDPERAYQPLATVLEAMKILQNKATGLVFTCEFPHATPADCSAHSYRRGNYHWIAPQMVHNDLDVVIGGGVSILSNDMEAYLTENDYHVYRNNLAGMRADKHNKMWALYGDSEMAYDIDRNPEEQPSIEEMTRTAIEKLSRNENGFFLMVEGSKVDWAAHANDPVGMYTDFLAFDKACGAALDFAKKDGETLVIIVPDHGNSGFSLGRRDCGGYDKLTKEQLFHNLAQVKLTAEGLTKMVNSKPNKEVQQIFRTYAGFELSEKELNALNHVKDYKNSPIPESERSSEGIEPSLYSGSLSSFMSKLITTKTCFGFTTGGHTGEEVFLAAYHPKGTPPMGRRTNVDLNHYMCEAVGIGHLDDLTNQIFARHTEVFKDFTCELIPSTEEKGSPTLVVKNKKNRNKQLTITPFSNIVKSGRKAQDEICLNSVIVYVDANETFYLPQSLAEYLK